MKKIDLETNYQSHSTVSLDQSNKQGLLDLYKLVYPMAMVAANNFAGADGKEVAELLLDIQDKRQNTHLSLVSNILTAQYHWDDYYKRNLFIGLSVLFPLEQVHLKDKQAYFQAALSPDLRKNLIPDTESARIFERRRFIGDKSFSINDIFKYGYTPLEFSGGIVIVDRNEVLNRKVILNEENNAYSTYLHRELTEAEKESKSFIEKRFEHRDIFSTGASLVLRIFDNLE